MAIAFVSGNGASTNSPVTNPGTYSLPAPPNLVVGNLMVVLVSDANATSAAATITMPAGWTAVAQSVAFINVHNLMSVYYKFVTASEPASYTVSYSGNSSGTYPGTVIAQFSGVNSTTPIDAAGSAATWSTSSSTQNCPSVTTAHANAMAVVMGSDNSDGLVTSVAGATVPAACNIKPATGSGADVFIGYAPRPTTGATGTFQATFPALALGGGYTLSLNPNVPTVVPSAPTTPTFSSVAPTSLTVNWTDASPASGAPDSFKLFRYVTSSGAGTAVQIGGTITGRSYNDTGLTANTGYSYYVQGVNNIGTGPSSATGSTTTPVYAVPTAPTTPTFTNVLGTSLTVNWTDPSPFYNAATSYNLFRYVTSAGAGTAVQIGGSITSPTYHDTGLSLSTGYSYYVQGVSSVGTGSFSATGSTTTDSSNGIQYVSGNSASKAGAVQPNNLTLPAPANIVAGNLLVIFTFDGYGIASSTASIAGFTAFGPQAGSTGSSGVGHAFYKVATSSEPANYTVTYGGGGSQIWPSASIAQFTGVNTFNPLDTTGTVADTTTCPSITTVHNNAMVVMAEGSYSGTSPTSFTGATIAVGTNVIYSGQSGSCIAYTPLPTPGTTPTYPAVGAGSGVSITLSLNPALPPATQLPSAATTPTFSNITMTTLTVAWTDPSPSQGAATSFNLFRYVTSAGAGTAVQVGGTITNLSYDDNGLTQGTGYSYYVQGVNAIGTGPSSSTATTTTLAAVVPSAPAAPTISNLHATVLDLAWTDSSPANGLATSYQLFRYVTSTGAGTAVQIGGTITSKSYQDSGLTQNTGYSYYVRGVNAVGAGPSSTTTTTTTPSSALTFYYLSNGSLDTTAPAASASLATTVAKSTGYIELRTRTPASTVLTAGTPNATTPAPSGFGFLYNLNSLEGQQIIAGTWQPKLRVSSSSVTTQAAFYYRVFKKNANSGVYTNLGVWSSTAAVVNTVANTPTTKTLTGPASLVAVNLAAGDRIYVDVIAQVTVSSGSASGTVSVYFNSGAADSLVTPGTAILPPGAPTGFTVTPLVGSTGEIDLAWTAPVNTGSGLVTYKIYRSIGSSTSNGSAGPFTLLNSTTSTSYADKGPLNNGLAAGTGHSYYVLAASAQDGTPTSTVSVYTNQNSTATLGAYQGSVTGTSSHVISLTTLAAMAAGDTLFVVIADTDAAAATLTCNNASVVPIAGGNPPDAVYSPNRGVINAFTINAAIPAGTVLVFTDTAATLMTAYAAVFFNVVGARHVYDQPYSFTTTTTPTDSGDTVAGLEIAFLTHNGGTTTATTPTGWSLLGTATETTNVARVYVGVNDNVVKNFSPVLGATRPGGTLNTHIQNGVAPYSPPAGTAWTLAGSATGRTTPAANLNNSVPLTGAIVGRSTPTADLTTAPSGVAQHLAGAVVAGTTTTGLLSEKDALVGAATTGRAITSASLTKSASLAATTTGRAVTSSNTRTTVGFASAITGHAVTSATDNKKTSYTATATGVGVTSNRVAIKQTYVGVAATGRSSTAASLGLLRGFAASTIGSATDQLTVSATKTFTATTTGRASVSTTIRSQVGFAAVATGRSSDSAVEGIIHALTGVTGGRAVTVGQDAASDALTGNCFGRASTLGLLAINQPLTAQATGRAVDSASLQNAHGLIGSATGVASTVAHVGGPITLDGEVRGAASTHATLGRVFTVVVSASGQASTSATASSAHTFIGVVAQGVASTSGLHSTLSRLTGSTQATATTAGFLSDIQALVGQALGRAITYDQDQITHTLVTTSSRGTSSTGNATLNVVGTLTGAAAGHAVTALRMGRTYMFAGASTGHATSSSTLDGTAALAGFSVGSSQDTVLLRTASRFSGTARGSATNAVTVTKTAHFSSTVTGLAVTMGQTAQRIKTFTTITTGVALTQTKLTAARTFAAVSTGRASDSALLGRRLVTSGTATGRATDIDQLSTKSSLSARTTGTSFSTGSLINVVLLDGSTGGAASTEAEFGGTPFLVMTVRTGARTSASLSLRHPMAASTRGAGSVSTRLAVQRLFVGTPTTGTGVPSGRLGARKVVGGSSQGASTTALTGKKFIGFTGSSVGGATTSWRLRSRAVFSGFIVGSSLPLAALDRTTTFSQVSRGVSTTRGSVDLAVHLSGTTFGRASDSGLLTKPVLMAGSSVGSAVIRGLIGRIRVAYGSSIGDSWNAARLSRSSTYHATTSGSSTDQAYFSVSETFAATVYGRGGEYALLFRTITGSAEANGRSSTYGRQVGQPQIAVVSITTTKAADMALNVVEVA